MRGLSFSDATNATRRWATPQRVDRGPDGCQNESMPSILFGLLLPLAPAARSELPTEAPLPPGASAAGEPGRYRSGRSYDETLDFYRRLFHQTGGVRWRNIVDQPDVRAKHVDSLRQRSRWEGLNVYEVRGEAFVYVLLRTPRLEGGQTLP